MRDFISATFTRENMTLALSIFGSVGTLITFISSYLTKRKNLKICITSCVYRKDLRRLIFVVTFENRSRLPIAITSISAIINTKNVESLSYPYHVGDYVYRSGKEILDSKIEYNLKLPADISQLSALSGYVLFELSPEEIESLATPLTLLIHSTRGRVQKIELKSNQIKWI